MDSAKLHETTNQLKQMCPHGKAKSKTPFCFVVPGENDTAFDKHILGVILRTSSILLLWQLFIFPELQANTKTGEGRHWHWCKLSKLYVGYMYNKQPFFFDFLRCQIFQRNILLEYPDVLYPMTVMLCSFTSNDIEGEKEVREQKIFFSLLNLFIGG